MVSLKMQDSGQWSEVANHNHSTHIMRKSMMKMIITSPPTTPTNTVAGTDAAAGPEYI